MTIGIDLSSLQSPHRMRGIGYTLINLLNNLPDDIKEKHFFVFYAYPDTVEELFDILDLQGFAYTIRDLKDKPVRRFHLPGKLNLLVKITRKLKALHGYSVGDDRIQDVSNVDCFLQTDQNKPLPSGKAIKKYLILYDIIPYVLEWDYMWSYGTARNAGLSRKAALRFHLLRWQYKHHLQVNAQRADKLLAISEQTRYDAVSYFGIDQTKIALTPLGVSLPSTTFAKEPIGLYRYVETSWGYTRQRSPTHITDPFILFVGGADKRRKLQDVITAFNSLRATGHTIKLVLAGDCMQGPNNIANEDIQNAFKNTSYIDDVIFLGFVDDQERNWLYGNALAFVFPSRYEGFGLPVLEAMAHGCPVISYPNKATVEVAGDTPLYASNSEEFASQISSLLNMDERKLQSLRKSSIKKAREYNWEETSRRVFAYVTAPPK